LECAVRVRALLDFLDEHQDAAAIAELDQTARDGLVIGSVSVGAFELTTREACNTIIHTRTVVPVWKWAKHKRKRLRYWCGDLDLSGEKSKKEWRMTLHVAASRGGVCRVHR
jgi:hypothetical protein